MSSHESPPDLVGREFYWERVPEFKDGLLKFEKIALDEQRTLESWSQITAY